MSAKAKKKRKRGDPELMDRLNRATGAYLLRTGKKVEQQHLAAAAKIGLSTMTDIANLDRKVTIADAIAFADYLGVEFAWLAAGRGPMTAPPEMKELTEDQKRRTLPAETVETRRPKSSENRGPNHKRGA